MTARQHTNTGVAPSSRGKCHAPRAVETLDLTRAVAEVEWLQVFRNIMVGDVTMRDKPSSLSPRAAPAQQDCQLAQVTSQSHIVDAKSWYTTY